MIRRITSSLPTFKNFEFRQRLNIVLADCAGGFSRNSAGKTSLIEIIHFVLGANTNLLFQTPELRSYLFTVDVDLPYGTVSATRSGDSPTRTYVYPTSLSFGLPPATDKKLSTKYFSLNNWRAVLGEAMFKLPLTELSGVGAPSFRALIGYFVRRQGAGGIAELHRAVRDQQIDSIQVNLSYLFDLDHRLPMELEVLRKRERQLRELKIAAKSGALGEIVSSAAHLRPRLAELDSIVRKLQDRLQAFRVLPEYHEYERRVAELRARIRELSEENLLDRDRLIQLREALASEPDVDDFRLGVVFGELQEMFPDAVKRQLTEVGAFHRSVVANRRQTIEREILSAEDRIATRSLAAEQYDSERSEIMQVLEGAGALTDFIILQKDLAQSQQELTLLRSQYKTAQTIEGGAAKLEAERKQLEIRIREDHIARAGRLEHAALIVRELVRALYEDRAGDLVIDVGPNGPTFRIEIEGDRSAGISRVEIWCFDMLLARLSAERGLGPGFLVHDSHIFDGVDTRQIATALQLGLEYSRLYDFQYIVTMNSDIFSQLDVGDDVRDAVLEPRLSDKRPDGGLFGIIVEAADLSEAEDRELPDESLASP